MYWNLWRGISITCLILIAMGVVSAPAMADIGMVVDIEGDVIVFDPGTDTVLAHVDLPFGTSGDCAITADGKLGFVSNRGRRIYVIDLETLGLAGGTNPIVVSNQAYDISITHDSKYIISSGATILQPLAVVDIEARSEISTFSTGLGNSSVEACDDGSVLVGIFIGPPPSYSGVIRRLTIDAMGVLSDTGEELDLASFRPFDVACVPGSETGLTARFVNPGVVSSFPIPIPASATATIQTLTGVAGVDVIAHPEGTAVYTRTWWTSGSRPSSVEGFEYDPSTGDFGARLFQVPVGAAPNLWGIDHLAVDADGEKVYVPEVGAVDVYDATDGTWLGVITDPEMGPTMGIAVAGGVLEVPIDILPDNPENPINPGSDGETKVAILSMEDPAFDATDVDPSTVLLENAPVAMSGRSGRFKTHLQDVNADGLPDMVVHIITSMLGLERRQRELTLTGETFGGIEFEGTDSIRIVPTRKGGLTKERLRR